MNLSQETFHLLYSLYIDSMEKDEFISQKCLFIIEKILVEAESQGMVERINGIYFVKTSNVGDKYLNSWRKYPL